MGEGLMLETPTLQQTCRAKDIPYQPLLIKTDLQFILRRVVLCIENTLILIAVTCICTSGWLFWSVKLLDHFRPFLG